MINKLFSYLDENEIKEINERISNNKNKQDPSNEFNELIDIINKLNKYCYNFNNDIKFNINDTIKMVIEAYFYDIINREPDVLYINEDNISYFYNSLFNELENYNICEKITKYLFLFNYSKYVSFELKKEKLNQFKKFDILYLFDNKYNPFNFFINKYNNDYIFKNEKLNNRFIKFVMNSCIDDFSNICRYIYGENNNEIKKDLVYDFINYIFKDINKNKLTKNDKYFIKTTINSFIDYFNYNNHFEKTYTSNFKSVVFDYFNNNNKFNDKSIDEFIYKNLLIKF